MPRVERRHDHAALPLPDGVVGEEEPFLEPHLAGDPRLVGRPSESLRTIAQHRTDDPMVGHEQQIARADAHADVGTVFLNPLGELLVDATLVELEGVAEEGNAARAGNVFVAARRAHMLSANSSRPISMRRISLVPAPISYSLASRHRRSTGKSLV